MSTSAAGLDAVQVTFEAGSVLGPDGVARYRRVWRHPAPRAAILYVHGLTSHGGWFEHTFGELANGGYTVLMPDRIGSGNSGGSRGETRGTAQWMADYQHWLGALQDEHPGLPIVILGACFGARIAVPLAAQASDAVKGLLLTTPGLFVKAPLFSSRWDKLKAVRAKLGLGNCFIDIPVPAELFTHTPRYIRFIQNDPLQLRRISTNVILAVLDLVKQLPAHAARVKVPVLALFADQDRMVDNEKTRAFLTSAMPQARLEIQDLPGYAHIPDFEEDPSLYLSLVRRWLDGLVA